MPGPRSNVPVGEWECKYGHVGGYVHTGRQWMCEPCRVVRGKKHYQDNRQDYIDKAARWANAHPGRRAAILARYSIKQRTQ
jgi:hypothetical protein